MRKMLKGASVLGALMLVAGSLSVAGAGVANAALCEPIGVWPYGAGNYCNYTTPAGTHVECTVVVAAGGHGLGCTIRYIDGVVQTCNEGGFLGLHVPGCPWWLP